MIVCSLGPDAPFYRALTPNWAHRPESGAGAALAGGRCNRPNVEARYLAATPEAALAEYQGESSLLPPATVATYQVTSEAMADFTGGSSLEESSEPTEVWRRAQAMNKRVFSRARVTVRSTVTRTQLIRVMHRTDNFLLSNMHWVGTQASAN